MPDHRREESLCRKGIQQETNNDQIETDGTGENPLKRNELGQDLDDDAKKKSKNILTEFRDQPWWKKEKTNSQKALALGQ